MSQSVSLSFKAVLNQGVANAIASANNNAVIEKLISLLDGTGAGKASKGYSAPRSLAASATDALDLAGGLTDAFGASITFTKIKMIIIKAADTNTGNLTVGGGTTPANSWLGAATDKVVIKPGGIFILAAPDANGYTVTNTSADLLNIVNTVAASAAYEILLAGE